MVQSLLHPIAGSSSSSSSSPNFPNCSSPRKSASVSATYLRSHFSISQPKALRSRARGYLSELCQATFPVESHSSFCSSFSPAEFLAAASKSYPIHRHWPRQSCLSHAKAPSLLWHGFTSLHLQSFLVFAFLSFHLEDIFHYSHTQDGKASRLSCFLPAYLSLTSCVSKLFERIILSRLLFFLESNSILSPRQASFRSGRSTLDQILYLSQSISDGFNKPRPGSRTILSTIDFSKALKTLSGIPPFTTN